MGTKMDISEVIKTSIDTFSLVKCSPGAFAGGTANARGNLAGTGNPATIFTVTGEVLVRVFAVCKTLLVGATATLELGLVGNTASLIAQTLATDIGANNIWLDATPSVGSDILANLTGPHIVVNGLDIVETVATANITAGEIEYICLFRPLSFDGKVESAY